MTPAQPARIHLLPAAQAPVVVVIRRKPSKLFHIIRVDTVTGKAEHGAWFDGQLYPGKCDVSFDGNWFIYLALGRARKHLERSLAAPAFDRGGGGGQQGHLSRRRILAIARGVVPEPLGRR